MVRLVHSLRDPLVVVSDCSIGGCKVQVGIRVSLVEAHRDLKYVPRIVLVSTTCWAQLVQICDVELGCLHEDV